MMNHWRPPPPSSASDDDDDDNDNESNNDFSPLILKSGNASNTARHSRSPTTRRHRRHQQGDESHNNNTNAATAIPSSSSSPPLPPSRSAQFHKISCFGQLLIMVSCVMVGIVIGTFDITFGFVDKNRPSTSSSQKQYSSSSSSSFSLWQTPSSANHALQDTTFNSFAVLSSSSSSSEEASFLALRPGELPGYTGWARPEHTVAGHFELLHAEYQPSEHDDSDSSSSSVVLGELRLLVHCAHNEKCRHGGTLFYLRMYGPAIISGVVQDYHNGTFQFTFTPMDAGLYTVEVVVTYSHPPPFAEFPLPTRTFPSGEPNYEGYLLSGFPLVVQIPTPTTNHQQQQQVKQQPLQQQQQQQQRRRCTTNDLTETSVTSASRKARWVVSDRVNQANYQPVTTPDSVTLEQYQWSLNSLGIQMQYQYPNCHLPLLHPSSSTTTTHTKEERNQQTTATPSWTSLPTTCLTKNKDKKLHFVFIGDSNLRLQRDFLESYLQQLFPNNNDGNDGNGGGYQKYIQITLVELFGGILKCRHDGQPNVTHVLQQLSRDNNEDGNRNIIIFNSGLHDIHRLCGQQWHDDRATYLSIPDEDLHCPKVYREALTDLVRQVAHTPATLRIFQTTTAGWPKYGNVGVLWPTDNPQQLPLSPDFVVPFNDIAYEVLRGVSSTTKKNADHDLFSKTIHITDGYWITISRPDHREVDEKSSIGKKLAHPGLEVLSVLNRILLTLVLEALQCEDDNS